MADIDLIRDITNAFGPSGFEEEVCRVIKKYTEEFDVTNDAMCNVYMKRKNVENDNALANLETTNISDTGNIKEGFRNKKPVLMLDAHSDECGMMIQGIRDNGLLNFLTLGGIHLTNLPAHSVIVRNREGKKIKGIITSKPVHFLKAGSASSCDLDIEELAIDVGASSREEVMEIYGIHIGDPVVPDVNFEYNEEQRLCYGKAFDNRLGCVCIIETMKELLKDENLAVDVVGAFAAQEEVGTRGATVTSQVVKPDFAIVFEGSPADDFYYSVGMAQGCLRKGVQIRHRDLSYISNPVFIDLAHKIGDKHDIKYQDTVRRGGSTNAGKISLEGKAVPVLVLGVPSRYVHTHSNFAAMEDIDAAIRMAAEVIRSLDDVVMDKILRKDILMD